MRRNPILFIIVLVMLAIWFFQAPPVEAQQPQPTPSDNDVNAIARELYCPVCENTPLDVCPTQACEEWRELIRLKLSQGWEETQIKDYFALQYGDRVLPEPPRRGLNWLVYILPAVFFAGGLVIVVSVMRNMRRAARPAAAAPEKPLAGDEEYLDRVEEALKKHNQ